MHNNLSQTFGTIILPLSYEASGVLSETNPHKGDNQLDHNLADQISTFLSYSNTEANGPNHDDYTLEELREAEQRRTRISELLIEELQQFFKILLNKGSK
jgi:hypothetical protein